MKKIFFLLTAVIILNGCAQSTAFVGPSYTMVKTGSIIEASSSLAASYGVKKTLGKSPYEYVMSLAKQDKDIRECQTFHTSSLSEIFFETLDEIDCLKNPFSIFK